MKYFLFGKNKPIIFIDHILTMVAISDVIGNRVVFNLTGGETATVYFKDEAAMYEFITNPQKSVNTL